MTILQKHLVFIPICFVAFVAVFGGLVMLLWNWLMPDIFGLPELNFWQSVGLLLLCKILFGGIQGNGKDAKEKTLLRQPKHTSSQHL